MRKLKRQGIAPLLIGSIIGAIVIAFSAGAFAGPSIIGSQASINYKPTTETRQFVIFSNTAEFNETVAGIPHDQFTPSTMVVNQGDTVKILFVNTEEEPEDHNFVLSQFGVNVNLAMGQNTTITFVADKAGVFTFYCTYHQPTMRGQLTVLPTGS